MATDNEPIRLTLTMSPALNAKLEQLATANCATKAEILRKAIALYELAHRASLKDQRLGVFDEDERLVMEIVGL
jgi:predicted transcriptional regulator